MDYNTLRCCRRLLRALDVDAMDTIDDVLELETLRRRDHLTRSQADRLIELLTTYRDVVSAI